MKKLIKSKNNIDLINVMNFNNTFESFKQVAFGSKISFNGPVVGKISDMVKKQLTQRIQLLQ